MPGLFLNAYHHGSLPQQLKVVWCLLLQADSEGPTLIFRVVTNKYYLLSWHTASRLSTEANAPLFQHRMIGTTFVSSVDIGSVNLLRVHFHLMYTFFLLSFNLINPKTCQKSIILALRKHNLTFIEPVANGVF